MPDRPITNNIANIVNSIYRQGAGLSGINNISDSEKYATPGQSLLLAGRSSVSDQIGTVNVGGFEIADLNLNLDAGAAPIQINVPLDKEPFVQHCNVSFSPSQDLHGYSNPWPAGGGKNKAKFADVILNDDRTQNGITFHALSENQVRISGWATGPAYLTNAQSYETLVAEGHFYAAGTYTMSSNLPHYGNSRVYMTGFLTDGTPISGNIVNNVYDGNPVTFTIADDVYANIQIVIVADSDYTTPVDVWVQIESGSTPTSWLPYENICPITGWQGAEVYIEPTYDPTATPKASVTFGQTVYGGTADIVSGNGNEDTDVYDMGDILWTMDSNRPGVFYGGIPDRARSSMVVMCEGYEVYNQPVTTTKDCYISGAPSYGGGIIFFRDSRYSSSEEATAGVTGIKVAYTKDTPIPFHVTPSSLTLLKGENWAWATMINE